MLCIKKLFNACSLVDGGHRQGDTCNLTEILHSHMHTWAVMEAYASACILPCRHVSSLLKMLLNLELVTLRPCRLLILKSGIHMLSPA
jgi:hypothetical protein